MPLDPSIALQVQAPKFEDQGNALARILQLQQAQGQNELAQYSISKARRQDEETNRLAQLMSGNGFDLNTPEGVRQAYGVAPTMAGTYIKNQLDQRKATADIGKTDAETQAKAIETAHKRVETLGQASGFLRDNPTLDNHVAVTQQLQQLGILTPEQAQASIARVQADPSPENIKKLATSAFTMALSAKDQLPKIEQADIGGQSIIRITNPVDGTTRVVSTVQKTQSPDNAATNETQRRGQDLVDARSRETTAATREANATVYDPERGVLINKGTGLARPAATMDGKPITAKDKNAPEAYSKAMTGVNELRAALATYERVLTEQGGPSVTATGEKRASLNAAYTALKMGLKNAYELGALTGPDVAVLEGALVSPTSVGTLPIGNDGIKAQISQAYEYLKNREGALEKTYGRPNPAKKDQTTGKTVKRTGTTPDGRKVVEYSDGSIEYAN